MRLEKDFLVIDMILHGSPVEYILKRKLIGVDINENN